MALVSEEELGRQKRRKVFSVEAEGTARVEGKKWEQQCLQKKWEEPVCGEQRAFVLCGRVGSGHRGQGRRPSPVLFQSWEGYSELRKWCCRRLVRLIG